MVVHLCVYLRYTINSIQYPEVTIFGVKTYGIQYRLRPKSDEKNFLHGDRSTKLGREWAKLSLVNPSLSLGRVVCQRGARTPMFSAESHQTKRNCPPTYSITAEDGTVHQPDAFLYIFRKPTLAPDVFAILGGLGSIYCTHHKTAGEMPQTYAGNETPQRYT